MAKEKSGKDMGNNGMNKAQSLMDKLIKNSRIKGIERLIDSDILNEKPTIRTKIPMINVALSGKMDGGCGSGITLICGASRNFKTSYGLLIASAFQEMYPDGVVYYINNEWGVKRTYLENYGIDISRTLHIPLEDIERLKFDLTAQLDILDENDHVLFFLDSLGNAASIKEITDALDEKSSQDMTRSKQLKSLFRIITPKLYMKNIPFIAINHTYKSQDGSFIAKDIIAGGQAMYYNSDNIWIVGKSQVKEKDEVTGANFTIKVEKSRFVREKASIPITVRFATGVAKWSGFGELATEFGIVKEGKIGKSSSYYYECLDGSRIDVLQSKSDLSDDFWERVLKETDLQFRIEHKYALPVSKPISDIEQNLGSEDDEEIDD